MLVPATLIRISMPSRLATASSIDLESAMSMRTALAFWPLAVSAAACSLSLSMDLAASTVWARASARPCAMARPMPRLAPATRAVLPAREKISFTILGYQSWNHSSAIDDVRWAADWRLIGLGGVDAQDSIDGVQQVFGLDGEIGDLDRFSLGGAENASAGDAGAGEGD